MPCICPRVALPAGGGPARLGAILDIAAQVASGMAYLHSANIIHAGGSKPQMYDAVRM